MFGNPQQGQNADEVTRLRQEAGLWLKGHREAVGLSQRDLARHMNIEYYTFISQIESGKGRVPPHQYAAMAKALKMKPHDFAKNMLRYYDPITFEMLFDGGSKEFARMKAPRTEVVVDSLSKRLAKLEKMVTKQPSE